MLSNGVSHSQEIVLGLVNFSGRYLTAEKFGNQMNVTGTSLRAKQMWTYEQTESASKGFLKSPQRNYLETSKSGDVMCNSDEKSDDYLLNVTISSDGKWSFCDRFGKYLAGTPDGLFTVPKIGKETEWAIHLANHPQCNVLSPTRKRYVCLDDDQLVANEDIPWTQDAVITMEFHDGRYALRDSYGRYLNGVKGTVEEKCTDDALFIISICGALIGFKASNGQHLTPYGPKGRLIANKTALGRDEMFQLEESKAQCVIIANNGKKVSIKQGIDVTASQFLEAEDTETFQICYHRDKTMFLTSEKTYWNVTEKSVTATATKPSPNAAFKMEWHDDKIALQAFNGKHIASKSGGQLTPTGTAPADDNSLFTIQLVNRPIIVLRGEHGYIGMVSSSNKIQCNRGIHNTMQVESVGSKYRLRTGRGTNWRVELDSTVVASVGEGDLFLFELHSKNKMLIRAQNGKYLKGDNNGSIAAIGEAADASTLWEY